VSDDLYTLARTIYGEARGEPWAGKLGVGWAIRNRVDADLHGDGKPDWWGEGYAAVCLKPYQFSCWNAKDPNRPKLLTVTTSDPDFRECLAAATGVMSGVEPDPTGGATHYKVSTLKWPRDWGAQKPPLAVIGAHTFYRLEN
jgi:N-acetylmuramoyl-L-alanine amidase